MLADPATARPETGHKDIEPPATVVVADDGGSGVVHDINAPTCPGLGEGPITVVDEEKIGTVVAGGIEHILPAVTIEISNGTASQQAEPHGGIAVAGLDSR